MKKHKKSRAKHFRWLQFISFTHRIHHTHWGYGFKLPFVPVFYFDEYGLKAVNNKLYHNCTTTGIY